MRPRIAWIEPSLFPIPSEAFSRVYHELSANATLYLLSSVEQAVELGPIKSIVLAIERPGLLFESDLHSLRECHPEVSLIVLLGDWCCGQKRLLDQHNMVHYRYVHELLDGFAYHQLFQDADVSLASKSLVGQTVGIYARQCSYRAALRETIHGFGAAVMELQFGDHDGSTAGMDTVVWEAAASPDEQARELNELRVKHAEARVVALVTYPRNFQRDEYRDTEISIVAQPFSLPDLFRSLQPPKDSMRTLKMTA